MNKEIQTELSKYFDLTGIAFDKDILLLLKKFQTEAFPYEHS